MGEDHQPIVVFGLKLDKSQILETVKITINECGCKPQKDPTLYPSATYCQTCGELLRRQVRKTTPKFEGFDDPENNDLKIGGWPAVVEIESCNFYVGFYVKKGVYGAYGETKHEFPDMLLMSQFKTDMKKIGLWNKNMFGAWLILDFSC